MSSRCSRSKDDGADVYEVEDIVDVTTINSRTHYRVKWVGWSKQHNSWEPLENIMNPLLVFEYLVRRGLLWCPP
jgi:hypothetical protein